MKTYCLFEGRHELPENSGSIASDFDFNTFKTVKTNNWNNAMNELKEEKTVQLIVTGLTPALTEFLSDIKGFKGKLILLHFNNITKKYVTQTF